jgi:signal transduction histidine kinase
MVNASSLRVPAPRPDLLRDQSLVRQIVVLCSYGAAFTALHHVALQWATGNLFSLWFPAAGLRFAFLWHFGARNSPAAALAELLAQLVSGEASLGTAPLLAIFGIVSPCLAYGLVIHFVRSRRGKRSTIIGLAPLPFALASVIGPMLACVAALPWAIPLAMEHGPIDGPMLLHSLLVFSLGDMLGVLIIAPPLVWLAERLRGKKSTRFPPPTVGVVVEAVLITAAAWAAVWGIDRAGFGLMLGPPLLAICWVGLRAGRPGAWLSILLAAAIVLPLTDLGTDESARLRLHMLLACIAAVGFLAGSFAEAEARSHAELARRDRLLFQAERLKTLRAMSVAVIHEISQPLSTISIEANGLLLASRAAQPDLREVAETSQLIARKAEDLSEMVRRLRGFGDHAADAPSRLSVPALLHELVVIAGTEAAAANIILDIREGPDALVMGQDIELRQALLNLVRNAIAASPRPGRVLIDHAIAADRVLIRIVNDHAPGSPGRGGMGVGLIIARSIAGANGGTIREDRIAPQTISYTLDLPLAGGPND